MKKTFAYADIRTNEEYNKTVSSSRIDFAFQNIFYATPDYSVQFSETKKSEGKVRDKLTQISPMSLRVARGNRMGLRSAALC